MEANIIKPILTGMMLPFALYSCGYRNEFNAGFEQRCPIKLYQAYYSKYSSDDHTIPIFFPVDGLVTATCQIYIYNHYDISHEDRVRIITGI